MRSADVVPIKATLGQLWQPSDEKRNEEVQTGSTNVFAKINEGSPADLPLLLRLCLRFEIASTGARDGFTVKYIHLYDSSFNYSRPDRKWERRDIYGGIRRAKTFAQSRTLLRTSESLIDQLRTL